MASGGLHDVTKHVGGTKHVSKAKMWDTGEQKLMDKFFSPISETTPLEVKVLTAEVLWSRFIVEHNLPISASDHATRLFKIMFSDSEIAKRFRSSRTKTTALIRQGCAEIQKKVAKDVGDKPFTLCTDGSNDKSDKFYPIILRHVNEAGDISSQLLSVANVTEASCTGM